MPASASTQRGSAPLSCCEDQNVFAPTARGLNGLGQPPLNRPSSELLSSVLARHTAHNMPAICNLLLRRCMEACTARLPARATA
eukprot:989472-Pelagomonas_calceolata.AAC.3